MVRGPMLPLSGGPTARVPDGGCGPPSCRFGAAGAEQCLLEPDLGGVWVRLPTT